MNIQDNRINLPAEMARRDEAILDEIRTAGYDGWVVNGQGSGCILSKHPFNLFFQKPLADHDQHRRPIPGIGLTVKLRWVAFNSIQEPSSSKNPLIRKI